MDAASSAAGLVGLAIQVASYAQTVKNADKDREALCKELKGLEPLLKRLEERGKAAPTNEPWMQGNEPLARILNQLRDLLEEMRHDLEPPKKRSVRKLYHRLMWTWEKGKFQDWAVLVARYMQQISVIVGEDQFVLSMDTNAVSKDTNVHVREVLKHNKESAERIQKIESQGQQTTGRLEDIKDTGDDTNAILRKMQAEKKTEDDEKERQDIAEWLSPFNFLPVQKDKFDKCYPLGQWLLKSDEFQRWFNEGPWQLRLLGDAGAGKSHLAAILVNHLQQSFDPDITPVICMYLESNKARSDYRMQADLTGGLLKQLIQQKESDSAPEELRAKYRKCKAIDAKLSLKELEEFFLAEIQRYDRVFLVVDGMDECSEGTQMWLEDLLKHEMMKNVTTLVTIRRSDPPMGSITCHNPECQDGPLKLYWRCQDCPESLGIEYCTKCKDEGLTCDNDPAHELIEPYEELELMVYTPQEELKVFVKGEMEKEMGPERKREKHDKRMHPTRVATSFGARLLKNPELADQVAAEIVDRADGKFLFAKLYWDSLKKQRTTGDIEEALGKFPDSLDKLYDDAMEERIMHQDNDYNSNLAKRILTILCCTRQYLNIDELMHALATVKGDKDFNRKRDYDQQVLQDVTKGYVSIGTGLSAPTRLFHATFDAYLHRTRDRWFPDATAEMATICLTYLNFPPLARPFRNMREFEDKEQAYPLIAYASQNWGFHVLEAGADPDLRADVRTDLRARVLEFLEDGGRVTACMQAAWCAQTHVDSHWSFPKRVDGLHACAWFGLAEEIVELANMRSAELDVDVREASTRQTPLMWACSRGNVGAVQKLLELGADVSAVDLKGRTALLEAIENNYEPVVRELVKVSGELEINTVYPTQLSRTALMLAAKLGHVDIVRALLQHPAVNTNHQDTEGRTALALATASDRTEVAEVLLARPEVDPNLVDSTAGYSALTWAALHGRAELVRKLLAHGADGTLRDHPDGYTAVMIAADYGKLDVVKAMLEHGVNVFGVDNHGRTLLHGACGGPQSDDQEELIDFLIEKGLGANMEDNNGSTALHEAAKTGKIMVAQTLLDKGADPNIKDKFGRNPFVVALQYGQESFLEGVEGNMLQRRGIDFDYQKEFFSDLELKDLPAWALVNLHRDELLDAAIAGRPDSLPDPEPISGENALHRAVDLDDLRALSKLLPYISPTARDHKGLTPLHVAAAAGNAAAVVLLLQHKADPEALDAWGSTALMRAQAYQHTAAALALVEGGASLAAPRLDLQKLLFAAVERDSVAAAERLVAQGASVVEKNETGQTALGFAKKLGNAEMIQAVKSSQTFFRDADEDTPLTSPDTPKMMGGRSPFRMPDDARA